MQRLLYVKTEDTVETARSFDGTPNDAWAHSAPAGLLMFRVAIRDAEEYAKTLHRIRIEGIAFLEVPA